MKEYTTKMKHGKVQAFQVCEHELSKDVTLSIAENVAYIMKHIIGLNDCNVEHAYLIVCTAKMKIKGIFMIGKGTLNGCMISPRDILLNTLLLNANNFFLIHNHPSGNPKPSAEDHILTKRIKEACAICDYKMLDHIILGEDTYYSFTGNNTKTIPNKLVNVD